MNLIVLGAPGAGKGTQARSLAQKFNLKHISTGDLLRKKVNSKSDIGLKISSLINKGMLVSDELATQLLKEELPKENFILDGYPRTLNQAKILDDMNLKIDKVICVEVKDKIIVERMSGRKICPNCSSMYHDFYHPPNKINVCDNCNSNLVQRDDDKMMTVLDRLKIYHELTEPIINFYAAKKILLRVDGTDSINKITEFIINRLEEFQNAYND
jgi:adenylate kinases